MKNNISYYGESHSKLIFWVICFVLFLPIIILPPQFQPSDWSRVILFKIAVTILISLFLYRFFYKKDISLSLPKKGYLFYLPLFVLSAYFVVLILSTIFSQDLRFSIFGSPSRAGGILNFSFFIIFTVFIAIFVKGGLWNKLMRINFIAGALASSLAIIQYFGLLKKIFLGFETGATPSFLGNSTFLAIYMLFLAFSSLTFFLLEKSKKWRLTYGGLFLLFLFTIFATGSRATYIAILIGFAFYCLFYPKKLVQDQYKAFNWINQKRLKLFKLAFIAFIVLIVLVVAFVNITQKLPNFIENNARLSYFINSRLSLEAVARDLAGTRLSAWKITLKALKEKPLLGWGPENSHIGFEKYFDPTLPPSLARQWWDRPHNIFLEVAVNSGIFALFLFIAFWAILLWQLQILKKSVARPIQNPGAKFSQDSKRLHVAHGLQAMFIGYLTVLFFNFDSFPTYLISFFFIGYALYLLSSNTDTDEISKDASGQIIIISPPRKDLPLKKLIAFIFLAMVALFFWFWNIKPLYFNEKVVLVKNLSESKQCKKALELANNTNWSKSGIIKPYAALNYSDIVKNCTFTEPQKEVEYSKKVVSLLKIASNVQPKFSRTWLFMGAFTNILAAREENKDNKNKLLLEAKSYLNEAIELSPKRQEFLIEMEKNYMLAEDYQSMEKIAKDCINIDFSYGECYWYLGIAQIFMGNQEAGKKNIELSKEKHYNDPPYLQLGIAYISQKNYKDAADAYHQLVAVYPDNASYHATLAVLYKEIKNYGRASMEAARVFELQPENLETIEFIKVLLGLNENDPTLHSSLAFIYKKLGMEKEYKEELLAIVYIYQQLIYKNPNSFHHHLNLAHAYRQLEEYEKSVKEALLAFKLAPNRKEEVEYFFSLIPPKFLDAYGKYLKDNPELFFKIYGHYPEKK